MPARHSELRMVNYYPVQPESATADNDQRAPRRIANRSIEPTKARYHPSDGGESSDEVTRHGSPDSLVVTRVGAESPPKAREFPVFIPGRQPNINFGRWNFDVYQLAASRIYGSSPLSAAPAFQFEAQWFATHFDDISKDLGFRLGNLPVSSYQLHGFELAEDRRYAIDGLGNPIRLDGFDSHKTSKEIEEEKTVGRYRFLRNLILQRRVVYTKQVLAWLALAQTQTSAVVDQRGPRRLIVHPSHLDISALSAESPHMWVGFDELKAFFRSYRV